MSHVSSAAAAGRRAAGVELAAPLSAGAQAAVAARQAAVSLAAERAAAAEATLRRTVHGASSFELAAAAAVARPKGRKPRTGPEAVAELMQRASALGL